MKKNDMKNIKYLFIVLIVLVIVNLNITLKNIFIVPIGQVLINLQNGNFEKNLFLKNNDINISLKKYKWSYSLTEYTHNTIIHFYGRMLNHKYFKYQLVDMYIYEENLTEENFVEIVNINKEKCEKIIKKKAIRNSLLLNITFCTKKNTTFVYYDIPSKKIIMIYYPYMNNLEDKEELKEFIDNITF
jgi:hypothetical protein